MSLQQKFTQSEKGDGIFRIPENPTKYSDIAFQNSINANNPKKAISTKGAVMPTSQLASIDKANTTKPGK